MLHPLNLRVAVLNWRHQARIFSVIAVCLPLLLSFGAKASIITSPTTIIDHGTYISDSISRLDWYKFSNVENTLGMSFNEVLASSFYLSGGWSVASGAQVQLLEGQFGWTSDTPFSGITANAGLTNAMGAYLGFTASYTDPTLLNFIFARTSDVVFQNRTYLTVSTWQATLGFAPINADFTDVHTTSRWVGESRPGSGEGVWLVRATAVPEPATITLLTLGLAGFGFSRRKKA